MASRITRNVTKIIISSFFQDIRDILKLADTIVYMAEFFSQCIKKIQVRLGTTVDTITKVESYLKTENRGTYQKVIDNSFTEHNCLEWKSEDSDAMFQVLYYYYGCTSILNIGEVKVNGDSGGDNGTNLMVTINFL